MASIFEVAFESSYNLEAISRVCFPDSLLYMNMYIALMTLQISTVFAAVLEDYNMEYVQIVDAMEEEITECDVMIERHMQKYEEGEMESVHCNLPPAAGHLRWATELKDRLDANLDRFRIMEHQE